MFLCHVYPKSIECFCLPSYLPRHDTGIVMVNLSRFCYFIPSSIFLKRKSLANEYFVGWREYYIGNMYHFYVKKNIQCDIHSITASQIHEQIQITLPHVKERHIVIVTQWISVLKRLCFTH